MRAWIEEYRCTFHTVLYLPVASVWVPLNVRERCIIYYFTLLQNEQREVFRFSCSPGTDHVSHSRSFNSSFSTQSALCCSYTLLIQLFGSLPNEAGDPFDIEIGCIFEYKVDWALPRVPGCLRLWRRMIPSIGWKEKRRGHHDIEVAHTTTRNSGRCLIVGCWNERGWVGASVCEALVQFRFCILLSAQAKDILGRNTHIKKTSHFKDFVQMDSRHL